MRAETSTNGNYCECCGTPDDVQLYIDVDDNAVDLCGSCHGALVEHYEATAR